jgi:hypothetical protein
MALILAVVKPAECHQLAKTRLLCIRSKRTPSINTTNQFESNRLLNATPWYPLLLAITQSGMAMSVARQRVVIS